VTKSIRGSNACTPIFDDSRTKRRTRRYTRLTICVDPMLFKTFQDLLLTWFVHALCRREFFGYPIFPLAHGQFHCKASIHLALEGRDESDPLCVRAGYCGSAPSWSARRSYPKLTCMHVSVVFETTREAPTIAWQGVRS